MIDSRAGREKVQINPEHHVVSENNEVLKQW